MVVWDFEIWAESMRRLGLGGGGGGDDQVYPERPGEQVCSYYIRTGYCAYGVKCRYNHPRDRGAVRIYCDVNSDVIYIWLL